MQSRPRVHRPPVELIKTGQPGAPRFALGLAYPRVADRRHQAHLRCGYTLGPVRGSSDYGMKVQLTIPVRVQSALFHQLPATIKASLTGSATPAIAAPRNHQHSTETSAVSPANDSVATPADREAMRVATISISL